MASSFFARIPPELQSIGEELRAREPIFHRPEFPTTMSPDYWEVGASGRRYSAEFIVRHLTENPPVDALAAGWQCTEYGLRQFGPNEYLFTYTLHQGERVTRRATIWQRTVEGWVVLYHQGTVVTVDADDAAAPE